MTDPGAEVAVTVVSGTQVKDRGEGPMLLAQRLRLEVLRGPEAGTDRTWDEPTITIGAGSDNDLPLTDRKVSRQHCRIERDGDRWVLADLGSTNGTFVDDARVERAEIKAGAVIRVGGTEISFEPKKKWERVEASAEESFGGLVGRSRASKQLFGLLERVAPTPLSCVLLGETGTGKELAARATHQHGTRAAGPFVVVDCGAVTPSLVESELFGHEKGAFTGADRERPGAFEVGNGGTVFLDEIGDLALDLQPKLLRAIERGVVRRVGSNTPVSVDVRIVCATHRPLVEMVDAGAFREDLYYRLAEVVVALPPLRERPEDIPIIAERIIEQEAERGAPVRRLSDAAMESLRQRAWPGNVRELRNVLRRAISLARTDELSPADLDIAAPPVPRRAVALPEPEPEVPPAVTMLPIEEARKKWMDSMERAYLERLLERCEGDLVKAAEVAGIHKKSLRRLLKQHDLLPPHNKA